MKTKEVILKQLDKILSNAEAMCQQAKQASQDELSTFEKRQANLLSELQELEKDLSPQDSQEEEFYNQLTAKINYFQQLNKDYIHLIQERFSLVHVDAIEKAAQSNIASIFKKYHQA